MDPNLQNQNTPQPQQVPQRDRGLELILPVNRSGWSIAAGYVALFNIPFFFTAPLGVIFGVLGLVEIGKKPGLAGKGRCWFAIVYGLLATAALTAIIVGTRR